MNLVLFLTITILFVAPLHGSEPDPNDPLFQFMHFNILAHPWETDPNPCEWRDGLDTETIIKNASCADYKATYNHFIEKPRNAIAEKFAPDFEILTNTLLFNRYGQWCCLVKNKDNPGRCSLLCGNNDSLVVMQD